VGGSDVERCQGVFRIEGDLERPDWPEPDARPAKCLALDRIIRHRSQKLVERDAPFEASQVRADAEMQSVPESHVPTELAHDIETTRIRIAPIVVIRGHPDEHDRLALRNPTAVDLDLTRRDPRWRLNGRRIVTGHLFDGVRHE